jgi:hypothetical protein
MTLKRVFQTYAPSTPTYSQTKSFHTNVDAASDTHFIFSHVPTVRQQAPRTMTKGQARYLIRTACFYLVPSGRFEVPTFKV